MYDIHIWIYTLSIARNLFPTRVQLRVRFLESYSQLVHTAQSEEMIAAQSSRDLSWAEVMVGPLAQGSRQGQYKRPI